MPKRRITLEEAAEAFRQAGLKVKVEAVVDDSPPLDIIDRPKKTPDLLGFNKVIKQVSPKTVQVYLYARHMTGSGGTAIGPKGQETVTGNTYQIYGPGHATVPAEIAGDLLNADAAARQADDRFLDRRHRQFVVTGVRDTAQRVHYMGIETSEEGFNTNMSPTEWQYNRNGYRTDSLGSI